MESSVKDNTNSADKLLHLLTLHLNCPVVSDEILHLCTHFKSIYFAALDIIFSTVSPSWNSVTMLLFYNSTLQKLFMLLLSNTSSLAVACLSIFPVKTLLKPLFNLATSGEKFLRYSAQNTLSFILINIKKPTNLEDFGKSLNYIFELIVQNQKKCTNVHIYNLELLNIFLKRFRLENTEACCDFLQLFLPKLCSGQFEKPEYCKGKTNFCALLKLLKEILNALPLSPVLLASTNAYIFKLIQTEDLCCKLGVQYRLVFLQNVALCLKYFRTSDNPYSLEAARLFLLATSDDRLVPYVLKEPDFVGFGSRRIINQQVKSEEIHGFSSAEKMLLLNNILCALCIVTERIQDNVEMISATEANLKILLGESLPEHIASKLFGIFLEQDDALIEFLLLHLIDYVAAERFKKSFLVSPHRLFVEMLQHLSFDSSVFLDWLTSNETQFLLYFLKYLKYLASNFDALLLECSSAFESTVISSVMNTLKNLRLSIEKLCSKDLFPYPVSPLLKVIRIVENLGLQYKVS